MSWAIRIQRVVDAVELRLTSAEGPLISWPNRGDGGDDFTWTCDDPAGETIDITGWIGGDATEVTLWCCPWRFSDGAFGAEGAALPRCDLDVLYDDEVVRRFEVTRDAKCYARRVIA